MKKVLFSFLISTTFLFSDSLSKNTIKSEEISIMKNTEKIEQPKELKLIYKKYYEDKTDFDKMTEDEALFILEYVTSIHDGGIGDAGSVSLERTAYNLLMGYPSSDKYFFSSTILFSIISEESDTEKAKSEAEKSEKLLVSLFLNSKTSAGKIYALMGLSSINLELYEKYYKQIDLESEIYVLSGCLGYSKKISDFLYAPNQIKNNSFNFNIL